MSGTASRVVVHVDCDAFYAQVEYRRLAIPRDTPLAVNQWGGLIAVSYPARAYGVRRGDRVEVAMQKCPQLVCVHVETRDENGKGDDDAMLLPPQGDRSSQKACLDRYREASEEVMAVIARFAARLEKASIDEAYLEVDVGGVQQGGGGGFREEEEEQEGDGGDGAAVEGREVVGIDGHRVDPGSPMDRALILAARVVARLRQAVLEETGFTVSAGIAHNKMLAKLCSARNKPDKQTIVPSTAISALMATVPVKEVRGLGGKLGEAVLAFLEEKEQGQGQGQQRMVVELQRFSEAELRGRFGPKEGAWLDRICRGIDDDPVVAKTETRSFGAFKSFEPVHSVEKVQTWLQVLAADLKSRLDKELTTHRRRATALTLVYRGTRRADHKAKWVAGQVGELTPTVSRVGAMPGGRSGVVPSVPALVAAGMALFLRVGGAKALPCTRLGLCASKFMEQPAGATSIVGFLGAAAKPSAAAAASSSSPQAKGKEEKKEKAVEAAAAAAVVNVEEEQEALDATRSCAKCGGKPIEREKWGEHADWHVAVELQRAYGGGDSDGISKDNSSNKRPSVAAAAPNARSVKKKGSNSSSRSSSSNKDSGPKSQTLEKFWKKK